MFTKSETSLIALAAEASKFQRVTTPWLLKQIAAMQADIRAEKDRRNARRRELRAIRRAERLAAAAPTGWDVVDTSVADESNVVAFPVAAVA